MSGMLKKISFYLFVLALIVCQNSVALGAPADDLDNAVANEEARMKQLERKIEEHRRNAQQIGKQEKSVLGELSKLEESTAIIQQQSRVLVTKTEKLKFEINKLNEEIAKTRARIGEVSKLLSQRFVSLSRQGEMEHLNLILSSENTHEAINSMYLLSRLSASDQKLMEELISQENSLVQNTERLKNSMGQFTQQSSQLSGKQREYNGVIQTTNKLLADVRNQKSIQEKAAREAEEAQRQIGRKIAELMQRKKERLGREQAGGSSSPTRQYQYLATGSMLNWPIRGTITSQFGLRVHPVFKTKSSHSGLDISAPQGTPVMAAGPGEVLYAGWQSGFGQVIIIDHGRDISTVYAHLEAIFVREGDAVGANSRIGAVGKSGTTTGYHLHFEVRTGTTARNPLSYLKK